MRLGQDVLAPLIINRNALIAQIWDQLVELGPVAGQNGDLAAPLAFIDKLLDFPGGPAVLLAVAVELAESQTSAGLFNVRAQIFDHLAVFFQRILYLAADLARFVQDLLMAAVILFQDDPQWLAGLGLEQVDIGGVG